MNPYGHADDALKELSRMIGAEFQNLSTTLPFDEINIAGAKRAVNSAYKRMDAYCLKKYLKVAKAAYRDACKRTDAAPSLIPKAAFVAAVLEAYNPVTQVVYGSEWIRKRDRTIEAIVSSPNRLALRKSLATSRSLVTRQVEWYTDIVTDEAMDKAYRDSGVKRVKWVTQRDGHVCDICLERDGNIYSIDNVPIKPHRGCRCYLVPAKQ